MRLLRVAVPCRNGCDGTPLLVEGLRVCTPGKARPLYTLTAVQTRTPVELLVRLIQGITSKPPQRPNIYLPGDNTRAHLGPTDALVVIIGSVIISGRQRGSAGRYPHHR